MVHQSGARVPKFKHTLEMEFPYMTHSQKSLLCVLLLRGRQSTSELRQRTERMHPFNDLEAVENQLIELIDNKPKPLVQRIPAGDGRRMETFVQLICTDQSADFSTTAAESATPAGPAPNPPSARIDELESEVTQLKTIVSELRSELENVKQQLGI